MNHLFVSVDSQPLSVNVITHPVIIYDNNDNVIQQSFSSIFALKLNCYPLWFQAISLVSDQSSISEHVIIFPLLLNSKTQAESEAEISKKTLHHSAIQLPFTHTFAALQLHTS